MRYTITGRNIDVTPGLRAAIEEKIGKLERYFLPDTEIIVTLSVQKDKQKIEVTIPVKGNIIRAEESSNDMYVSIDLGMRSLNASFVSTKTNSSTKSSPHSPSPICLSVRKLSRRTKSRL